MTTHPSRACAARAARRRPAQRRRGAERDSRRPDALSLVASTPGAATRAATVQTKLAIGAFQSSPAVFVIDPIFMYCAEIISSIRAVKNTIVTSSDEII